MYSLFNWDDTTDSYCDGSCWDLSSCTCSPYDDDDDDDGGLDW